MNKKEIIDELNEIELDKNEFWVSGSASLVLRDIIENANDIDLSITEKAFKEIENKSIFLGVNHNTKWYRLNDTIEFCIDNKTEDKVEYKEPYNLLDLNYYYDNFLKDSDREKDKEKKIIIKNILNK